MGKINKLEEINMQHGNFWFQPASKCSLLYEVMYAVFPYTNNFPLIKRRQIYIIRFTRSRLYIKDSTVS